MCGKRSVATDTGARRYEIYVGRRGRCWCFLPGCGCDTGRLPAKTLLQVGSALLRCSLTYVPFGKRVVWQAGCGCNTGRLPADTLRQVCIPPTIEQCFQHRREASCKRVGQMQKVITLLLRHNTAVWFQSCTHEQRHPEKVLAQVMHSARRMARLLYALHLLLADPLLPLGAVQAPEYATGESFRQAAGSAGCTAALQWQAALHAAPAAGGPPVAPASSAGTRTSYK